MKHIVGLIIVAAALSVVPTAVGRLEWTNTELEFKPEPGVREVTGVYEFKNVGPGPVTITRVKTTCGCTTTKLDKKTYAPGESGSIEANMTLGGSGLRRKHIYVYTNAEGARPTTLTIAAESREVLKIAPKIVIWRVGDEAAPKNVLLRVAQEEAVEITDVSSSNDRFELDLKELEKGRRYQLEIVPKSTDIGATDTIRLKTNYATDKSLDFYVYARVVNLPPPPKARPRQERQEKPDANDKTNQ